jgi:hypothetical protein
VKGLLKILLTGLLLGLTACLTVLELLLAGNWLWGTLYILQYGAAENPYAAEDAEITGILAIYLLPLVLAAWAGTVFWIMLRYKSRVLDAQSEK